MSVADKVDPFSESKTKEDPEQTIQALLAEVDDLRDKLAAMPTVAMIVKDVLKALDLRKPKKAAKDKPEKGEGGFSIKRGDAVNFHIEGSMSNPALSLALNDVNPGDRLDLLQFPMFGGEVIRHRDVIHVDEFQKLNNPHVKKRGCWS